MPLYYSQLRLLCPCWGTSCEKWVFWKSKYTYNCSSSSILRTSKNRFVKNDFPFIFQCWLFNFSMLTLLKPIFFALWILISFITCLEFFIPQILCQQSNDHRFLFRFSQILVFHLLLTNPQKEFQTVEFWQMITHAVTLSIVTSFKSLGHVWIIRFFEFIRSQFHQHPVTFYQHYCISFNCSTLSSRVFLAGCLHLLSFQQTSSCNVSMKAFKWSQTWSVDT